MYNSLPAPEFDVNFGMTTSCNSEWAGPRTEVVQWLVGDADTYFKSATLKKINAFYTHTYITVKPIKANSQNHLWKCQLQTIFRCLHKKEWADKTSLYLQGF